MANKDGIVSIGFDYKKELDEVCATIEKELNNLGGDINLSDGIKKQMAEIKKMITDMKKDIGSSFDKITETKLDTKTFESFKKDVNKRIREVSKEVTILKEQFSALDGSANVNGIVQQFANLKKYVEDSNSSISELISNSKKLGQSIKLKNESSNLKENVDDIKKQIDSLERSLNVLDGNGMTSYKSKSVEKLKEDIIELVANFDKVQNEYKVLFETLNGTDKSSSLFISLEKQATEYELKLAEILTRIDTIRNEIDNKGLEKYEKQLADYNNRKIVKTKSDGSVEYAKEPNYPSPIDLSDIIPLDIDEKIDELIDNGFKSGVSKAKALLSELKTELNSITNQPEKTELNGASNNIELHISTKQSTINKQLDEMIDNLQQRAANKPIIAPVKLRVDSEYEKTTKDASVPALTENQINEARKDVENVVPGLEKAFNNSMRIATNKAVENAKESIKAIREFFESNPITVHLTVPEDERLKIGKSILSEDGKTTVDISGQVDKARKSVKGLSEDLEKSQLLIKENAQNAKNLSLEKLVNSLSETMAQFSELKVIISSIQNMENTIARASGISSTNELVEQWSIVEKTIINATKLDGDFRKNANMGKIVSEYQKYIDMGGTNALSSIDKIKDNETTINSILSKMKELKSQDVENDSIQKLSVDLDGVIAKFDELISTVKTATNALYKIIKQGGVSDLDKQWSSISNKFKSIADESGKINLSKQKTDIKELMDMYQRYENADGTNSLMSLTDNVETLRKLDKEYQKLNQTQSVDNSSTIEKESESFKSVEKSVDSLTTAIGDTKVQAINVEATAMEDAAEREIMAIRSILDNLDLVVSRLKDIKGIKLPKIEVKNVDVVKKAVASLENTGNKSNISSASDIQNIESKTDAIQNQSKAYREWSDAIKYGIDRMQKAKELHDAGLLPYDVDNGGTQRINRDKLVANKIVTNNALEKGGSWSDFSNASEEYIKAVLNKLGMTSEQFHAQLKAINTIETTDYWKNISSGGWIRYGTSNESNVEKATKELNYKIYAAFEDAINLTKENISDILNRLQKEGFVGQLKTNPSVDTIGETDQIVIHGRNEIDQKIAYNVLKAYAEETGKNFSFLDGGFDQRKPSSKSFSTLLSGGLVNIDEYKEKLQETRIEAEKTSDALDKINNPDTSKTPIKDVFQGDKIDQTTTSAKELDKTLEQVNIPTDSFDEVLSKLDLTKSELKEIVKITKQSVSDSEGKFHDSYTLKDKLGSTEIYGLSSNTEKGQLLRSNIVQYDYKNAEQDAKALLEVERQLTKEAEQQTSAQQKKWKAFQQEQVNYEKTVNEVNNAISKTDELLNKLQLHEKLDSQFLGLLDSVDELNSKLKAGEISVSDYNKSVKSLTSEYSKLVTVQQNRDMETYKQNAKATEQEAKAVKEVWDKNVKAIQDYMDAVTKLNNLKAQDKGTGTKSSQIALQEKNVEELKEKALDARAAITSMVNPHDVPIDTWRDWLDVMKKFDQASVGSAESVAKLEDALRNMNNSLLSSAQNKVNNANIDIEKLLKRDVQSDEYIKAIGNYRIAIDELQNHITHLNNNGIQSQDDINELKRLQGAVDEASKSIKNMSAPERGASLAKSSTVFLKIEELRDKYKGMSKDMQRELDRLERKFAGLGASIDTGRAIGELKQFETQLIKTGTATNSLWSAMKDKAFYNFANQLGTMVSFYDLINLGRQGFNVIKDLDSALTEMKKVSDETTSSLKEFQSASFDVAKQVGTTALEIQNSAADFMRLGYSLKEASKLSEDANIYANVGDMDIAEATEHMISSIQAWQSEFSSATEASTNIIDRYNEIGNRFAITSADIGSAMERSAAALKAAGNTLNESIGIITAGNLIQQDADTTANALKVLSLRIRGSKADLESMGESVDDLVDSTSKMREQIQSLTGVDIMIDENTFKSTAKIIQEIGAEWSKLTDVSKAATLELLAGKTRASTVAGLIENYQTIEEVIKAAEESENSARIENEKYIQSIEGRLNLLQSQAQEFWYKVIDSDTIKNGITLLTNLLELGTDIVDTFGVLPTIMTGIGAGLAVKNVGINTLVAY